MNRTDVTFAHRAVLIGLLLFGLAGVCCAQDFNYIVNPPRVQVSADVVPDGLPYCKNASLGSLICYSPNFVRTAYNFPTGLDGTGHAMAPGANIVLVVASTNSGNAINSAEARAIKLYPGSIMSQSFGIPEIFIHA